MSALNVNLCKLCWRNPAEKSKFCLEHNPKTHNSNYKQGIRLLSSFKNEIQQLEARDFRYNAKENFDMFFKGKKTTATISTFKKWLKKYRPYVLNKINLNNNVIYYFAVTYKQIENANGIDTHTFIANETLNQILIANPHLLYLKLLHCESWLKAREGKSANWGGKRINSGRKHGA